MDGDLDVPIMDGKPDDKLAAPVFVGMFDDITACLFHHELKLKAESSIHLRVLTRLFNKGEDLG